MYAFFSLHDQVSNILKLKKPVFLIIKAILYDTHLRLLPAFTRKMEDAR